MSFCKKMLTAIFAFVIGIGAAFADGKQASADLSFYVPPYTYITPITSPVLTANITDRTGLTGAGEGPERN